VKLKMSPGSNVHPAAAAGGTSINGQWLTAKHKLFGHGGTKSASRYGRQIAKQLLGVVRCPLSIT
jgi:hypothetical protein